jgi:4-carboxymuconolactone decarboxylase
VTNPDATLTLLAEMTSPEVAERIRSGQQPPQFAQELGKLAFDFVFGELWLRPGLDRRSRSLVTLGVLIALRATDQLRFHIPVALRNGLSAEEIAEVIYHCSGYAGFPAASAAQSIAAAIVEELRVGSSVSETP